MTCETIRRPARTSDGSSLTERRSSLEHSLAIPLETQRLLFLDARSALQFSPEPVPVDVIRDVYDLVRWAPTGFNTVPMRLVVAESGDARTRAIAHASAGNKPKLERAPLIVVAARDPGYHAFAEQLVPGEAGRRERERLESLVAHREKSSFMNGVLQMGYLIVGLRAAGLDVRPMAGFDKAGLDADLLAGTGWKSELVLAVGYPAEEGPGVDERWPRLSFEQAAKVL